MVLVVLLGVSSLDTGFFLNRVSPSICHREETGHQRRNKS